MTKKKSRTPVLKKKVPKKKAPKKKIRTQVSRTVSATPGQPRGRVRRDEPRKDEPNKGTSKGDTSFPIVGVGASAGGLEAFTQLLKALPLDNGAALVLVQHLDPEHDSALTQILSRVTSLPVHEITDNQPVEPNHVYVIPRDTSLSIVQGVLRLEPRKKKSRTPHKPIDAFFESLAQDQGNRAIGVVLSGTANDGTLGLEAIKAEGGITFAQDDSAKYDSMPRSAVAAGCVDRVLSPADIAGELARIAKHPSVVGQAPEPSPRQERSPSQEDDRGEDKRGEDDRAEATAHADDDTPLPSGGKASRRPSAGQARAEASRVALTASERDADSGYKKILLLLRNHSGVDFSLYKSNTIQRRISRRMILTKHNTLDEYSDFLRGNGKELDALYSDVLISVTSFFRNPEMFDSLKQKVLPELLKQRGDDPLRCWVLGCSTGQEAYSIAMTFVEAAEKAPRLRKLQIFATDLNDALLDKARHGLYARSLAEEITPERLRRFFAEEEGGYRISKTLREMVVFARQNLIADPPFSRMDLVSCRNLLIYLEPSLQKKAMPTFHYALKPGGFLLLGASESIGGFTELFEPVDKKHKIFSRKAAVTPPFHMTARREHGEHAAAIPRSPLPMRQPPPPSELESLHGELSAQREADRITVNQFAPPAVLVSADLQVLQFRGPTGAYLEPPSGKASFDVLKMAREGLMLPLRSAINHARKNNKTARKEGVRLKQNGKTLTVNLEVIPLKNLRERNFLILFEEAGKTGRARAPAQPRISKKEQPQRIGELETDLAETREYLHVMQEQQEAAIEELQAANEEVQSANEELQSVNEELETSKEELESSNEELTTVNEEMGNRNVELNRLNNDLVNLQTSTQLAILLLGRDLTLRRFSAQASKQFDLLATDVGRPIGHIRHGLVGLQSVSEPAADAPVDLESLLAEVIKSVREQEHEVRDRAGRWYSLHARPYMTLDNKVDGAVLVLMDIDALKRSEQDIAAARDYAENIVETVRGPLLVLNSQLRVESANRAFYQTFRVAPTETTGRFIYDLGHRQWDIPRLRELLEKILAQNMPIEDFQVEHEFETIGAKVMLLNARRMVHPQLKSERILLAIEDITERTQAEEVLRLSREDAVQARHTVEQLNEKLRESESRYRTLFSSMDEGYCIIEMIFDQHEQPVDYRFLEVNPAFEKQSGMSNVTGKRMLEFVSDIEGHWLANYSNVALTGEPIRFANEYKSLGRWFDAYAFRVGGRNSRRVAILFNDITARQVMESALRESESRFRQMIDALPAAVYTTDAGGRLTHFNPAAVKFAGRTPVLGEDEWCPSWKLLNADGTSLPHDRCPMATSLKEGRDVRGVELIVERPDGTRVRGMPYPTPLRNSAGEIVGGINMVMDITERKAAEEHKNMLMAELDHRVKNTLMVISALMVQTAKSVDSTKDFAKVMEGRLQALSRVHSLLNQQHSLHVQLRDIVDGELDAYRSATQENILIVGTEAVCLTPKATQTLAMAIHELATNAAKYGALSTSSGTVAVNWHVANSTQAPRLRIEWIESGGPPVVTPTRRGFGSQLIERIVSAELQADVQRDFLAEGVRCTIDFALTDKTGYALAAAKHDRQ